jgi:hypothetical protein
MNEIYKKKQLTLATVEAAMHITLMKNPKQRATSFLRTNVFDPPSFQGDYGIWIQQNFEVYEYILWRGKMHLAAFLQEYL